MKELIERIATSRSLGRYVCMILAVGSAVVVLANVGLAVFSDRLPNPVEVEIAASPDVELPVGTQSTRFIAEVSRTDDTAVRLVAAAVYLAEGVVVVVGLLLLAFALRDAERLQPFSRANVRRIRGIGLLAVGWFAIEWIGGPIAAWTQNRLGSSTISAEMNSGAFWVAVGLFALARVWARGAELAELDAATI